MLADGGRLRHRGDHAVGEVVGVRAGVAHAADAVDRADRAQQVGEVVGAVVVRVDGLAQQHDLVDALRDDLVRLAHDLGELAAPLGTARGGHDAIRAAVVAAALDRDPGLHAPEAARAEVLVVLLEVEVGRAEALAVAGAVDQRRQHAVGVGSDDELDAGVGREESGAEALGHAAGDAEDGTGLEVATQLAEAADDALFGVLADGAGVDEHDVGADRGVLRDVAFGLQLAVHQLGVADVHLAAVGFYVDGRHGDAGTWRAMRGARRNGVRALGGMRGAATTVRGGLRWCRCR